MPRSEPTALRDISTPTGRRVSDTGPQALTEIERKILDFMVQYLRSNTYQPSIREIGERFGIKSTKTVSEHLQALADKGYLERDPSRSRGVKILGMDLSAQTVSLPCFREMPQGRGEKPDLHLAIDRRLGGDKGGFFVRAGTADLAVLGIQEGDYVLVEPANLGDVEDGAVVVVQAGTGSWFHRLTRNGTGVRLDSLRAGGEKIEVEDGERLHLLGRVTAFYRRMDESAGPLNLTHH
ncbi:MAG: S24 family peptidase [Longimicrobiales bacterium]|nr:S24 family peptidase [Longimicrobiales bacterium]